MSLNIRCTFPDGQHLIVAQDLRQLYNLNCNAKKNSGIDFD
jgi:hypothetical protein